MVTKPKAAHGGGDSGPPSRTREGSGDAATPAHEHRRSMDAPENVIRAQETTGEIARRGRSGRRREGSAVRPRKLSPRPMPGAAGSPEHKAARWTSYQQRTGGKGWPYKRWSNVYDSNMVKAKRAHAAVDAFHRILGWGEREVTLMVEGEPRRLDIADEANRRGVEYKTGRQAGSYSNR